MTLKRSLLLILFMLFSTGLFASDVPIIFVHGHKSEARPYKEIKDEETGEIIKIIGGWTTWYPMKPDLSLDFPTAMTKIINSHYGGYVAGDPLNCDVDSTPRSTGRNTRVVYNFSWYSPDGSPGVISYNNDTILVYIKWVYDESGRKVVAVIAPFCSNYPPSDYDSATYYPKYVPGLSLRNIPGFGPMWIVTGATNNYVKQYGDSAHISCNFSLQ